MPRRRPVNSKGEKSFRLIAILVSALVLILAGAGIWWSQNPAEDGSGQIGPHLAFNQEKLDLGRQPFDKTVRAEFKITNSGDRTLTLDASAPVRVVEGC